LHKSRAAGNLAIGTYNDIFQSNSDAINTGESITDLPLNELFPPDYHPFLVTDDSAMERLVRSVKQYGVREPGLARPRKDGGYELIAGNRRKRACELAEIPIMPVIIREMDDDSAVIAMVDSNLEQREKLLPSEKAWAYRVKMEALNHRGLKSDTPGQQSVEILCEQTGESKNQIYRLIRLTSLVPAMLDKVDAKKLAFNPAVEISYLTRTEQSYVVEIMERYDMKPSLSQAVRLKAASKDSRLTLLDAEGILAVHEEKQSHITEKSVLKRFKGYFPDSYTAKQMERVIVELLQDWRDQKPVQTDQRLGV
jgi:ParB family chromosome partitioning protein